MLPQLELQLKALFDLSNLLNQPRFIVEVAAKGSETLAEAYEFVQSKTIRGKSLVDYPLEVVALILDASHLEPVRQKLHTLPHRIVQIQDTHPETLSKALKSMGIVPEEALFLSEQLPTLESRFRWVLLRPITQKELLELAGKGWFPLPGQPVVFEKRDYRIRQARLTDLPTLEKLEQLCWPADLRMPRDALQRRIEIYPEGQLALEEKGVVEGVVYTQRIQAIDPIYQKQADTVHELHDPAGSYIQLLALNILPEKQKGEYGGELLEFALQNASLTPNVTHVIGVTRCINYPGPEKLSMQDYLKLTPLDPVPQMHVLHGAEIRDVVPNYRPKDLANAGYGVLVYYPLKERTPVEDLSRKQTELKQELTAETIGQAVDAAIRRLLSDPNQYSRSTPLMDLGLESLQLMELRSHLSEAFLIELTPTFFFQMELRKKPSPI